MTTGCKQVYNGTRVPGSFLFSEGLWNNILTTRYCLDLLFSVSIAILLILKEVKNNRSIVLE